MPQDDGETRRGSAAFDLVQFGVADAATGDAQQDFARARLGVRDGFEREGSRILGERSESAQKHGFHGIISKQKRDEHPRLLHVILILQVEKFVGAPKCWDDHRVQAAVQSRSIL
jgi:hypothetical protein